MELDRSTKYSFRGVSLVKKRTGGGIRPERKEGAAEKVATNQEGERTNARGGSLRRRKERKKTDGAVGGRGSRCVKKIARKIKKSVCEGDDRKRKQKTKQGG